MSAEEGASKDMGVGTRVWVKASHVLSVKETKRRFGEENWQMGKLRGVISEVLAGSRSRLVRLDGYKVDIKIGVRWLNSDELIVKSVEPIQQQEHQHQEQHHHQSILEDIVGDEGMLFPPPLPLKEGFEFETNDQGNIESRKRALEDGEEQQKTKVVGGAHCLAGLTGLNRDHGFWSSKNPKARCRDCRLRGKPVARGSRYCQLCTSKALGNDPKLLPHHIHALCSECQGLHPFEPALTGSTSGAKKG